MKDALFSAACKAMANSHSRYSSFPVGAALLSSNGTIHSGCNVENASYGLTICAERNAMAHAVTCGELKFSAIAIVTDTPRPTPPCGACRQALSEFSPELMVIMQTTKGEQLILSLDELLPYRFES